MTGGQPPRCGEEQQHEAEEAHDRRGSEHGARLAGPLGLLGGFHLGQLHLLLQQLLEVAGQLGEQLAERLLVGRVLVRVVGAGHQRARRDEAVRRGRAGASSLPPSSSLEARTARRRRYEQACSHPLILHLFPS